MPHTHLSRKLCLVMTGLMVLLTIIVVGYFGSTVMSTPQPGNEKGGNETTLKLLHVVFRHGPRTPADTYPNDPHVNQTFYPYGWGHITNAGKRELFNIGTGLRRRYGNFIGSYYQPDLVHAQATGVTRTLMSLETVLASMFPPKSTPMEWNSKYNWQPIPVFSQPLNEDTVSFSKELSLREREIRILLKLLLVRTACPRYYEALHETLELEAVKEEIKPYEHIFPELSELTGMNITEPEDIQSLYLTLMAEQEFGLPLPAWIKSYFPAKMQFLSEQSYVYNVWTREMQKIKAGPFLTKMLNEMKAKASNNLTPKSRKMYIYTGHDSTIVNIMAALQIWSRQMPRYSAMAIFELHRNIDTGEYYVEIYFSNNPKEQLQKLTVPGCEFQCPLEKLIELTHDVLIDSSRDKNRCEAKSEAFTEPPLRGP